jgi:hypothetical protein
MDVHESCNGLLLLGIPGDLSYHALDGAHCRVQFGVRIYKLAIQVIATERRPVVPDDHPIRIGHRYYFEDYPLPQFDRVRVCRTRYVR